METAKFIAEFISGLDSSHLIFIICLLLIGKSIFDGWREYKRNGYAKQGEVKEVEARLNKALENHDKSNTEDFKEVKQMIRSLAEKVDRILFAKKE